MKQLLLTLLLIPNLLTAAPFTDHGDQTVTDLGTSLMWQQSTSASSMNWATALTTCEELTLAGHSDWRLPNVKELRTIADSTKAAVAIDSVYFPGAQTQYWSSTVYSLDKTNAFHMRTSDAGVFKSIQTSTYYVRCVR